MHSPGGEMSFFHGGNDGGDASAAYMTLMKTVESLQGDLQETITTCHSLREANSRLSKGYEAAKAEAGRQREKFQVTRSQLVEATKAKIESDRNTEVVVAKWKSQLDERTSELDMLQAKLVPQDLDMLRIEIQEELEEPHEQKVREIESRARDAEAAYFESRRELERRKAEFDEYVSSQTAALQNEKQRSEKAVSALKSRLGEIEAELEDAKVTFSREKSDASREHLYFKVQKEHHATELGNLQRAFATEKDHFADVLKEKTKSLAEADAKNLKINCDFKKLHLEKKSLQEAYETMKLSSERRESDFLTLKKAMAEADADAKKKEKALTVKIDDLRLESKNLRLEHDREREDFLQCEETFLRRREALEVENASLRSAASEARLGRDAAVEKARAEARDLIASLEDQVLKVEVAKTEALKVSEHALSDAVAEKRKIEAQLTTEKAQRLKLDTESERTLKPRIHSLERERDALLADLEDMRRKGARLDDANAKAQQYERQLSQLRDAQQALQKHIASLDNELQKAHDANDRLKSTHAQDLNALKKALKADRLANAAALRAEIQHTKQASDDKLRKERKRSNAYKERAIRERDRTYSSSFFLSFLTFLDHRCHASQGRPRQGRQRPRRRPIILHSPPDPTTPQHRHDVDRRC